MKDLRFGVSVAPTLNIAHAQALTRTAESSALDLVGIQNHPVQAVGPEAVDLVADVAFDQNIDLATALLRYGGSIAYATSDPRPTVPFWELGFKNIAVRFLSNDDFPESANQSAARDLTAALVAGDLRYEIRTSYALERVVEAHEDVERGGTSRVVVDVP